MSCDFSLNNDPILEIKLTNRKHLSIVLPNSNGTDGYTLEML